MNAWKALDTEQFEHLSSEETIRGATWTVMASPYDIPLAFRSGKDDEYYIVEFKYLSKRGSTVEHDENEDGVLFVTDRYSHRLYEIKIPKAVLNNPKSLANGVSQGVEYIVNRALEESEYVENHFKNSRGIPYAIQALKGQDLDLAM